MATMTHAYTAKFLQILMDGKPYTCAELAVAAGVTEDKARRVLSDLLHRNRIESSPVKYQITPEGADRAMWRPADHNALRNERRRLARKQKARAKSDEQQEQIIRSVPNSVFALGAMA